MPVDRDITTGGIKRPKKPRAPRLPVTKSGPMFNPAADISAGRVSEAVPQRSSVPRAPRSNIAPLTTQPNQSDIALSAVAALRSRQAQSTTTPYSGYSAMMADTGYEDRTYESRSYLPPVAKPEVQEFEDRVPEDTVTLNGIRQKVMRRLSRRGGQGIVNPMSPIAGYEMGPGYDSDFGPRVHPIDGGLRTHTGDDISQPAGTPVYAPVGGVVSGSAATGGAYGNQVIMDHGKGQQTMFGHLSQLAVPPGTKVKKGEVIGYVGTTGYSTGPHLHYEQWQDGQEIDPATGYQEGFNDDAVQQAVQRYMQKHPEAISNSEPAEQFGQNLHSNGRSLPSMPVQQPVQQPGQLAGNPQLDALMKAIREQESGGDYSVQNGIGARGAYQIMPSNIDGQGGWDAEALGAEITGEQFLNSPILQNKIAKFKLKDYFKKYGAAGAARAWYAGPGNATLNSDGPQYGGPSVNDYSDSVLNLMRKYL